MLETEQEQTRQTAQKFIVTLNRTSDQQPDTIQVNQSIQYMKRFYSSQNSFTKLKKLINYYTLNIIKSRFLHPEVKKLQKNNIVIQSNGISPTLSQSNVQLKILARPMLTSSLFTSKNSIDYIRQMVHSLQKKEKEKVEKIKTPYYKFGLIDKKFSKKLNYTPYHSRKNMTKATQIKFRGQIQKIQEKWIKSSKILNKSRQ